MPLSETSSGACVTEVVVGILIRRYHLGLTTHRDLQNAVDRLMTDSTLYMGPAFREYAQRLIRDIGPK